MTKQPKSKVLITGITGFIGSHTAIRLLNEGYPVRGTMRNLGRAEEIKAIIHKHAPIDKLEFAKAELTNSEDWDAAMEGIGLVQHIASPLPRTLPKDDQKLIIPARKGVLNVLRAAEKHGAKRVVLTSSVSAIGYGYPYKKKTYTEADWTDASNMRYTNPYVRSKTIAERAGWDFVNSESVKIELTAVNPVAVMGPALEKDFGTSGLLVKKLMSGKFPGLPRLGFCLVDVRDVAEMNYQAMINPEAAGKRIICNSGFMWLTDIAAYLKSAYPTHEKKIPSIRFPDILVRLFSLFDGETRAVINELGIEKNYDDTLARQLFNWNPRTPQASLSGMADSLIEMGII
ncbi:MAG: aldehyde reductase [Bacteroidota bacterium]